MLGRSSEERRAATALSLQLGAGALFADPFASSLVIEANPSMFMYAEACQKYFQLSVMLQSGTSSAAFINLWHAFLRHADYHWQAW